MGCGPSREESTTSLQGLIDHRLESGLKGLKAKSSSAAFTDSQRYRPSSSHIDVIQWDRISSGDPPEDDPEIVSLHHTTFFQNLDEALKKSCETQTDPVNDEAFDWDLSDKTDIETQTNPQTRIGSTVSGVDVKPVQDVLVQTDQRLTFLLHRSEEERLKRKEDADHASLNEGGGVKRSHVTYADASCQTYIEVQSVGIQVRDDCID